MTTTEIALKERIKELTCLYEVSSIINNASPQDIGATLKAIANSLKKGFHKPGITAIAIAIDDEYYGSSQLAVDSKLQADIMIFNKVGGHITAYLTQPEESFLPEEQPLLDNVAIKLGNLFERIEIQRNEASLKRQMERADRLGILGELTAGIAHELNTPLANILGFAELLQNSVKDNEEAVDDLNKIISNAIFSREVVKKLMFFACEMPQEMQQVNIVPCIKEAMTLLDASFKKAGVKYLVKIDEEELYLKADYIQLTQIIFNLIINAIYFSPKDGLIIISAFQDDHQMIIEVQDQGEGLSGKDIDKIFQPFYTTKPTGAGSGLGLSVVHGIVSSHNGTITAVNNKQGGATFTIKLPKS